MMLKEKVPRVDGFSIEFFTICWDELQSDLLNVVFYFFNTSEMDKGVNCTAITLVPKMPSPTLVKDYRPIACCTTIYKIITKLITRRLKSVIGDLIVDALFAFIDGRCITDNILFSYKLFKGYNRKGISLRCS